MNSLPPEMLSSAPLLTPEEVRKLHREGDYKALAEANLRFVAFMARKWEHAFDVTDAFQEGVIGLLQGIPSYDPDRGKFVSHVSGYISLAISRWAHARRFGKRTCRDWGTRVHNVDTRYSYVVAPEDTVEIAHLRVLRSDLEEGFQALTYLQETVLRWHYFDGLTFAEIARRLGHGTSRQAAHTAAKCGLGALRNHMIGKGYRP